MPLPLLEIARATAWKLADRVDVFADWKGFADMALPGDVPGGLLRWAARMVTTIGLSDLWWWLPYLVFGGLLGMVLMMLFRKGHCMLWIALGIAIAAYPLVTTGWMVWHDREPSFPVQNALGLATTGLTILALRKYRGSLSGIAIGLIATFVAFVPLGSYALLIIAGHIVDVVLHGKQYLARRRMVLAIIATLGISVMVPSVMCRLAYDDLDTRVGLAESWCWRWKFDTGDEIVKHIAMERLVKVCDWHGVETSAANNGDFPLRMEIAYRLLAQYRMGTILADLFRYPIRTDHVRTTAQERQMDGYLLLFNYGFLLPARREIYERMFASGPEPSHWRYLGDIAFLRGEFELARRDYLQLARCPFRAGFAKSRLAALKAEAGRGAEDLVPIAGMSEFWRRWHEEHREEPFVSVDEKVEDFVYTRFRRLKEGPPEMVRMTLAAALLSGDVKKITENFHLLDYFNPSPQPWPKSVQEAILMYLDDLEPSERDKVGSAIRQGAITSDVANRYREFLRVRNLWKKDGSDVRLRRMYGDTFWFYKWYVLDGEGT